METSIEESLFETHEIREAKSSGFLSWTFFGGGWAERSFRVEGDWFSTYKTEGFHFSGDPNVDKGKGTIAANFKSSHGHDLRVDVKTYRPEKDLPSSKQRVKVGKSTRFHRFLIEPVVPQRTVPQKKVGQIGLRSSQAGFRRISGATRSTGLA